MARIRTIKPSFFTSLTMASLTYEQRLTFIGLWTQSDDAGRSIYDPRLIKAAIWPLDDRSAEDIHGDIMALTEASLITHYIVNERSFLSVNGWAEHQKINRPTPSTFPDPNSGHIVPLTSSDEDSVSDHGLLTEGSLGERKGKEGKGINTPSASPSGFDEFWDLYPRKVGKDAARKAWISAIKRSDVEMIMSGLEVFRIEARSMETQFIPHPATWLNAGRWADEPRRQSRRVPGQMRSEALL